jgi:hypothetical protein
MARTLPEKNFSTRILEKNAFKFMATVNDLDDGEVWEWEFFENGTDIYVGEQIKINQQGFSPK